MLEEFLKYTKITLWVKSYSKEENMLIMRVLIYINSNTKNLNQKFLSTSSIYQTKTESIFYFWISFFEYIKKL